MDHSVTTHALPGPCVPPPFDGVLRTCSNQPLPSGLRPTAVLEATVSKSEGQFFVSVSIIPNRQGSPPGKLADAEVMFEAASGPLSGMKSIGFAVWERCDGGRNVDVPGPTVLRERRTSELRTVASRTRTSARRRRSSGASSTRISARRLTPDRPEGFPGGAGSAPPPGTAVLSRWNVVRRPPGRRLAERTPLWRP